MLLAILTEREDTAAGRRRERAPAQTAVSRSGPRLRRRRAGAAVAGAYRRRALVLERELERRDDGHPKCVLDLAPLWRCRLGLGRSSERGRVGGCVGGRSCGCRLRPLVTRLWAGLLARRLGRVETEDARAGDGGRRGGGGVADGDSVVVVVGREPQLVLEVVLDGGGERSGVGRLALGPTRPRGRRSRHLMREGPAMMGWSPSRGQVGAGWD